MYAVTTSHTFQMSGKERTSRPIECDEPFKLTLLEILLCEIAYSFVLHACMHACMFASMRSTTVRLVHHMPNVCNVHSTLNKPKIIRKCQRYIVHSTETLSFNSFSACFGFFPFRTESLGLFYFYIFIIPLNPTAFFFMLMLRLHCPFRK